MSMLQMLLADSTEGLSYVFEVLQKPWAVRAVISSLLIGLTCGVIGCFIVLRNMSLIGDALSHSILPGIFVAFLFFGYSTVGFFAGSVVAGLITAVVITWIQQNVSTKNDAAIGIVFTVMFSIGVIGITFLSDKGGVHLDLNDFLFGDVLEVGRDDLILTSLVTVYTLISIVLLYRYLFITTFQPTIAQTMGISVAAIHYFLMLILSFTVVSALMSVGVILVVAMLITPGSTALLLSHDLKKVLGIAGFLGMLSAFIGMVIAILLDTPPGPAMVIVATLIYFLVAFFSPQRGILVRYLRRRKQRIKIEQEDILRQGVKQKNTTIAKATLKEKLGYNDVKLANRLREMKQKGLVSVNGGEVALTAKGKMEADALVRAHRLWETYQVNKMGLGEGQIHGEADLLEHHLTEEILDEVDSHLGYPEHDPHGAPIPKKGVSTTVSLLGQKLNKKIYFKKDQPYQQIEGELWELGLVHQSSAIVKEITDENVTILQNGKLIDVPVSVARNVEVGRRKNE